MGKKRTAKRFITVKADYDGRRWQHFVPGYVGKVNVGDVVVVDDERCGGFGLATVESVDSCARHSPGNIRPIVDKVNTKRWSRFVRDESAKSQLMSEMAKRQAELEALSLYERSAESDPAMKQLLSEYARLS